MTIVNDQSTADPIMHPIAKPMPSSAPGRHRVTSTTDPERRAAQYVRDVSKEARRDRLAGETLMLRLRATARPKLQGLRSGALEFLHGLRVQLTVIGVTVAVVMGFLLLGGAR